MAMASRPSISIRPDVGSMILLIILRVVVFPHPEGPTSVTNSPLPHSRVRSSQRRVESPGKTFVTSSRRIMRVAGHQHLQAPGAQ